MRFRLGQSAIAAGYRLEAHESVGSTNAMALDAARAGDPGRLWIVSGRQDSGRGRRGRAWETPAGNLAATLLVAGGFGHSRLREWVLGGTTRELLQEARIPVLFSH